MFAHWCSQGVYTVQFEQYWVTSGFWPRVRARALRAPVFLSSFPKRGAARPPHPSIAASLLLIRSPNIYKIYKVLTYEEYRAVSGVFQNIDPPTPLYSANMSFPRTKGGYTTLAGKWGSGRSIFWKTPDIGLASYSIISLRYNLSNLGSPRQGLFSFHWTTEVVKYEVPCPPPPPPSQPNWYLRQYFEVNRCDHMP